MPDALPPNFTNRLGRERSPYLRQHAHNPVDWFPWGEEAFARARAEQKPIFLSVGYSTCHWCHVMAHESFESESIAERLNRDFVAVKVDREERPDVDRVYMTYVQAATGQGGWPMSVWLTPELKPFYGGTYFPPEDRWGRPGFTAILTALAQGWANQQAQLLVEGDRVAEALRQFAAERNPIGAGGADLATAARAAGSRCLQQLAESFDDVHGGFGGAPKFPRAAVFGFLLRTAEQPKAESGDWRPEREAPERRSGLPAPQSGTAISALTLASETLRHMAEGGIHDHVGGGFHRYSVDEEWFVPHFEKMLYDQAQLAVSYLEARQATGDERFAWAARGLFEYVLRDLAHPEGGFYSAEDADSALPDSGNRKPERQLQDVGAAFRSPIGDPRNRDRAEGAFYLWTKDEIARLLGDDAALLCAHFDVEEAGNVPEARDPHGEFRGKNILRQRRPLAKTAARFGIEPGIACDRLQDGLSRLREARARRPRPPRDEKIVTAWNGLMISALAKGHQVLGGAAFLPAGIRAAEFLWREAFDVEAGVLRRSFCEGRGDVEGFAEDYAYLIQGLLDLYEAAFEVRWLQWAAELQARMDALFWDSEHGGYFNSRLDDHAIIVRLKENYDGAEPAPSSVAVLNLLRLDAMIGGHQPPDSTGLSYADRARRCAEAFRSQWETAPHSLPQMLGALGSLGAPPRTVVLAGDPRAGDFRALAAVVHGSSGPRPVLLAADQAEGQAWLAVRRPELAGMTPLDGRAAAYVCERLACQAPVTDPEALGRIITSPRRPEVAA